MTSQFDSSNPLGYLGINLVDTPQIISVNRPPTVNDWQSFNPGDEWRDVSVSPPDLWILRSVSGNQGTWEKFVPASGGVSSVTGTGNINVSPTTGATVVSLTGTIPIGNGGTGLSTTPALDEILIGNGSGYTLTNTLPVQTGGTGTNGFADANSIVLTGPSATTPFHSLTTGASGTVLTSNGAGAAPIWTSNAGGNVNGPVSSTDRAISTWNGSTGTALFDNQFAIIDSSGRFTNTKQPAFIAYCQNSSVGGVTGNGAQWGLGNQNGATFVTVYDQDSNISFPGNIMTFTCNKTGKYAFSGQVAFQDLTAAMESNGVTIAASVGGSVYYQFGLIHAGNVKTSGNQLFIPFSFEFELNATNTLVIEVQLINGAGNTANISGHPTTRMTFWGGHLVC